MSEVQRITVLWPVGPHGYGNYPVVLASEYDKVQSELAALREELAKSKEALHKEEKLLILLSDQKDAMSYRLTAAEQRNAELVGHLNTASIILKSIAHHLRAFHKIAKAHWCGYLDDALGGADCESARIDEALTKPTESGASE